MNFWDFFWLLLWGFYFVAYIYVLILIILDLFRDHTLNGWFKAVWIVFLVFVPFLTALVYVIARGRGMAARLRSRHGVVAESDDYQPKASSDPTGDIARAKELLDAGAISSGEFEALKSKALGNQYFGA
ncbi:SHOCT domain-containing protein [uncultured Microbacterium sp.]|uniref:SHOCT domain-containing protein n=1 Tax=uncultured Microbacterium sp. TaxID=191216 RepID=UPI0035CB4079